MTDTQTLGKRIRIGVSACLLGRTVRFDGQHKRHAWINDVLARHCDLVGFCPEVASGLPVPRPAIRLVKRDGVHELHYSQGNADPELTGRMQEYADQVVRDFGSSLDGFIFKKDSPSCGVFRVRVYNDKGMPERDGQGIFTRKLLELMPYLPVEEEGRLNDPGLRQNFLDKVMLYREWKDLLESPASVDAFTRFHARHKFAIMSRSTTDYREIGRLVASANWRNLRPVMHEYLHRVMAALSKPLTRKKQTNVLQHLAGFLKKHLDQADRQDLASLVEQYRLGFIPVDAPLALLRHYMKKYRIDYINNQSYFEAKEVLYARA